jgi:hypothetical protein
MTEMNRRTIEDVMQEEEGRRSDYWDTHKEEAKAADTRDCELCGVSRWGYPFVWWHFPATDHLREMKGTGGLPDLVCPYCYIRYRYMTELQQRTSEDALLQLLKDRNWHLWLLELEQYGRHDVIIVNGPQKGRFAYVVQHYARGYAREGEQPSSDFAPIPCYTVAIADGQLDEYEEEVINWMRVEEGYDYSVTLWHEENLREYLRNPEAWLARQADGDLLTVEQAAERLDVSAKTTYEYCSQWYSYGEYNEELHIATDGQSQQGKRKKTRKLYNIRTSNGIRVPSWAVDLFQMWYAHSPVRPLRTTAYDLLQLLSPGHTPDAERLRQTVVTWTPVFDEVRGDGAPRRAIVGVKSDDAEWDTARFQRTLEAWFSGAEERDEGEVR